MPKKKLKFTEDQASKLPLAAHLTGIKLSDPFRGGGYVIFEALYKTEDDLVSLGVHLTKTSPQEVADFKAYQEKEAAKKEEAKATKEASLQPKPATGGASKAK